MRCLISRVQKFEYQWLFQVNEKRSVRSYKNVPDIAYNTVLEAKYRLLRLDYMEFLSTHIEEAQETHFVFAD